MNQSVGLRNLGSKDFYTFDLKGVWYEFWKGQVLNARAKGQRNPIPMWPQDIGFLFLFFSLKPRHCRHASMLSYLDKCKHMPLAFSKILVNKFSFGGWGSGTFLGMLLLWYNILYPPLLCPSFWLLPFYLWKWYIFFVYGAMWFNCFPNDSQKTFSRIFTTPQYNE